MCDIIYVRQLGSNNQCNINNERPQNTARKIKNLLKTIPKVLKLFLFFVPSFLITNSNIDDVDMNKLNDFYFNALIYLISFHPQSQTHAIITRTHYSKVFR